MSHSLKFAERGKCGFRPGQKKGEANLPAVPGLGAKFADVAAPSVLKGRAARADGPHAGNPVIAVW